MSEANLRGWHRTIGKFLALFILLQAGTGLWLNFEPLAGPEAPPPPGQAAQPDFVEALHHGGGALGMVFRLGVGGGIVVQTLLGSWIGLKISARQRPKA